jgi:ParB-like chromosome segregation protein Spo0J
MAKRKRLTPLLGDFGMEPGADMPPPGTRSPFPLPGAAASGLAVSGLAVSGRAAPIAGVAADASATAALDEMAETLRAAREGGRMVLALPLEAVDTGYLVRDRIAMDSEDMAALMASLRQRGQQAPIEAVALPDGRYGLISGWRRLQALMRLRDETGDQVTFGTVLALLRRPEHAAEAYQAMVEENEIRVGLSFYERARIAVKTVENGVYDSEKAALLDLFRNASRARRSKIRSFIGIVRALDGGLRFPEALGERAGLVLAKALDGDAALAGRVRAALVLTPPDDAAAEQALCLRVCAGDAVPAAAWPKPATDVEAAPGLWLRTHADGALTLHGNRVDTDLRAQLLAWLNAVRPA